MRQCRHCGAEVTLGDPIGREAACESCGHDLRACRQCRHYDTRYNNSCRETMADPVEDKDRRNFCEYFAFNPERFEGKVIGTARRDQARARLESLFRKGGAPWTPDRKADAKEKLEDLFRKKPDPPEG